MWNEKQEDEEEKEIKNKILKDAIITVELTKATELLQEQQKELKKKGLVYHDNKTEKFN